jgi:DNA polymerase-3 subunit chi
LAELGFYHLTRTPLEDALPRLLEKVVESGKRAVLRAADEERLEALNRSLWTYANDSFLPHGTRADGSADAQPVYLTTEVENPNGAAILVLVDAAEAPDLASFERCLELFDGRDERAVAWRGSAGRRRRRPATRSSTGARTSAAVGCAARRAGRGPRPRPFPARRPVAISRADPGDPGRAAAARSRWPPPPSAPSRSSSRTRPGAT